MKRILLLVSLLFAANAYSQVLWSDDFESYELGDFLDQGGWMRDGGEDDCVQVVNLDEAYGKSLQMNTT